MSASFPSSCLNLIIQIDLEQLWISSELWAVHSLLCKENRTEQHVNFAATSKAYLHFRSLLLK